MICFEGPSADVVWRAALHRLRTVETIQESRDQATKELLHCAFTITDPRQRLVFARAINPAFAVAEIIWIMAGANDIEFLNFWNPRMRQFTDGDARWFYGAYGYRLGSLPQLSLSASQQLRHKMFPGKKRLDQIKAAYRALQHIPHSRQVVMQIWDSKYDLPDPEPRSKDVPCNLVSHLMLRDGKLEWLQVMRSNDLIWGTPYNFIQFTTMQEIMAGWLGVEVGTYTHISDSLHVYQRHWEEVEDIESQMRSGQIISNHADLRIRSYSEWEALWKEMIDGTLELTRWTTCADLISAAKKLLKLPPAYAEWGALLAAEALRRRGYTAEANDMITYAGLFWATSWRQWALTKETPRPT